MSPGRLPLCVVRARISILGRLHDRGELTPKAVAPACGIELSIQRARAWVRKIRAMKEHARAA